MNAAERIRAALERTEAARHISDVPPPDPAENQQAQPVESTLRLVSTSDSERASHAEPVATPPPDEQPVRVRIVQEPAPVPEPWPTSAPPRPEDDSATELRLWAAEVPARRRKLSGTWIVLAAILAAAAVVAVLLRGVWLPGRSAPPVVTVLQLAVESDDNGLISLRWNGQSVPVVQAREGRLSILEDQKAPRTVSLNPGQLGAGHLFYESSSDRVEFQLEVVEKSGALVRESAVAAKKPDPTAVPVSEQAENTAQATPSPADNPAVEETPKPVQPALRTFTPPPAPAPPDRAGEGRVILMDPAPALSGGSALPAGAILPERVDIIPPPRAAAPPKTAPAQRVQMGGRLQSAMLVRKVEPVYPALARQMRIQGVVRFQAVIGKEGDVQNITFVSGPRALEKAASDAVKRWVYRPTLLNGRPVEVSTEIDINFTLGN